MKRFDNGVSFYTKALATVKVFFPEKDVCCGWCRFASFDSVGRLKCRLNDEMLYSQETRGENCPLVFEDTKMN